MKEYNEQVVETLDDAGCIIANKNIIIDNLQARIAELEAENERLKDNHEAACVIIADMHAAAIGEVTNPKLGVVEDVADVRAKLAASQLRETQLGEALQTYIDEHEECQDVDDWMAMMCSMEAHHAADEALSQPSDTSALDTFVAEKVKEYQERLADALAVLGADSQIEAEAVMLNYKKQVSTLTMQRDLAGDAMREALESGEDGDWQSARRILASAIKESDGK